MQICRFIISFWVSTRIDLHAPMLRNSSASSDCPVLQGFVPLLSEKFCFIPFAFIPPPKISSSKLVHGLNLYFQVFFNAEWNYDPTWSIIDGKAHMLLGVNTGIYHSMSWSFGFWLQNNKMAMAVMPNQSSKRQPRNQLMTVRSVFT